MTAASIENGEAGDNDGVCTLTCTVDREEAWLFEATRTLLEQLGAGSKHRRGAGYRAA